MIVMSWGDMGAMQENMVILWCFLLSTIHYSSFLVTFILSLIIGLVEKDLIRELLKECAKMYKFDHPNVLKLSGVCLDGGPAPLIIMPFMVNGSLDCYLKREREDLLLDIDSSKHDDLVRKSPEHKSGSSIRCFCHRCQPIKIRNGTKSDFQ